MREFKVIGHRGACAHEPENTIASVRRAIADGACMIEIDVRLAGGEIVVIHDDTVDRTTEGSGSIYDLPIEEIRDLGIPLLDEVLVETLGVLPLNIEMKDTQVCTPVCELIAGELEQVLLSSFHHEAVIEARELLPEVPIGILAKNDSNKLDAMFELGDRLAAKSLHPHVDCVATEVVEKAHGADFLVIPYTARTPEQLASLLEAGADGCFADDPKWAIEFARDAR